MKKLALFDVIILVASILLVVVLFIPTRSGETKKTQVTYETSLEASVIYSEAQNTKEIFLNTEKDPVKIVSVAKEGEKLKITLEGQGKIEEGRYIFNGQRVLVGQKAELHGKFWSQGIITKVEYAKT